MTKGKFKHNNLILTMNKSYVTYYNCTFYIYSTVLFVVMPYAKIDTSNVL